MLKNAQYINQLVHLCEVILKKIFVNYNNNSSELLLRAKQLYGSILIDKKDLSDLQFLDVFIKKDDSYV